MAAFTGIAPLCGGWLADYFVNRSLNVDVSWTGPKGQRLMHFLSLHEWGFLFLISALIAVLSLEWLAAVREKGEAEKDLVVRIMRSNLRNNLKDYFIIGNLINLHGHLKSIIRRSAYILRKDGPDKENPLQPPAP
jgi:hypothetical protein